MIRILFPNENIANRINDFVRCANNIESDVIVTSGNRIVDGKSILGLMTLNLSGPVTVNIYDRGEDEKELVKLLDKYDIEIMWTE